MVSPVLIDASIKLNMEDFNPANINGYAKVIARPVAKRAPNRDMGEGV